MDKRNRLLFQVLLWGGIWLILLITQNLSRRFIAENIPVFLFQISLITYLIYYAAPLLFEEKKYKKILTTSLLLIFIFSVISITFFVFLKPADPVVVTNEIRRPGPPILARLTPALFLLVAYLLALFIEGIHFLQKKEQETILIKNEALQSELKLLKSQINPHFLFNTLNNIYALAAFDAPKTQQSISYLSDMLRYVLYDCEQPLVSLQKEVKYIEDYLRLFSLKSSKQYPIETDFQIVDATVNIAPMVLIPFVENALKHSHIEKIKDAFITIFLKVTKEKIHFDLKNSIPQHRISKDAVGGIGLDNVQKRLAILYPQKHQLIVEQQDNTFTVSLTINPQKDA